MSEGAALHTPDHAQPAQTRRAAASRCPSRCAVMPSAEWRPRSAPMRGSRRQRDAQRWQQVAAVRKM